MIRRLLEENENLLLQKIFKKDLLKNYKQMYDWK
jgi:hypothetical protein